MTPLPNGLEGVGTLCDGQQRHVAVDFAENVAAGHQARLVAFGYRRASPGQRERAAFGPEADRSRRHDLLGAGLERCLYGHLEINLLAPGLGFRLHRQRGDEGARRGRVLQGRARRALWPGNVDARTAHRAGSQCSMTNCRFCIPLNSFTESRYAARTGEGRGSSELKRIASTVRPARASLSLRCFSPTTRWPSTSNSSQNSGCGKPCPQTWVSSSCARPRLRYAGSSEPSVSTARASCAGESSSRATASKLCAKRAKSSGRSVRPAAAACPPKRRSRCGSRFATRSSASRRCKPAIERPEPRISSGPAGAKAKVGRWWRSLTRPARMPTTPWCQLEI